MTTSPTRPAGGRPRPSLLGRFLGLFSSVTFGIVLMSILFVYSCIGSAGLWYPVKLNVFNFPDNWIQLPLRQLRGFEMTEFEWFHWWPFDLLLGLICLTITVVTLRRIKLNTLNLGVWMIHTGILVLCLGSVIYFSTKVEGDAPVVRRQVAITLPTGETGSLTAVPGTTTVVGKGSDAYQFQVWSCDPEWEILTGEHAGEKAFSVQVAVTGGGRQFLRQLLVGYPEYTEDVVASDDPAQPMARAIKVVGKPVVDEALQLSLEYQPATWFYLANWVSKSWALYLREVNPDGTRSPWVERPVFDDMPLYNDYIRSTEEVWLPGDGVVPVDPLDIVVDAANPSDPLAEVPLTIRSYLRYATMQTRQVAGGSELSPTVAVLLDDGRGNVLDEELKAFDPARFQAAGGFVALRWAGSEAERESLVVARPHQVVFRIPGQDGEFVHEVEEVSWNDRELPFLPVPDSDYEFRVEFVEDLGGRGGVGKMASVELRTPERDFRRWLFEDDRKNHDVSAFRPEDEAPHDHSDPDHVHEEPKNRLVPDETYPTDEGIEIAYLAGNNPAPVTIVAGPGADDVGVVFHFGTDGDGSYHPVALGERVSLGRGESLVVQSVVTHSSTQTRPWIVPLTQRVRDVKEGNSMVRVEFVQGGETYSPWVSFHQYPFEDPADTLRRYRYNPAKVRLADGRHLELVLSRQRLPLPAPVVLDDFTVTPHVGGFTGRMSSILNWTSQVRFEEPDGSFTASMPVSVNAPAENNGLWYFQAQWDPPMGPRFRGDPSSAGLNYTVLGVGNRNGVHIQLLGCVISVIGMLYAFYIKPQIRRRRREQSRSAQPSRAKRAGKLAAPLPSMSALSEEQA